MKLEINYLKKYFSQAIRQWWELKRDNFDTILFFKVGKFYELYHQDAVIAVKQLGLTFMRVIILYLTKTTFINENKLFQREIMLTAVSLK